MYFCLSRFLLRKWGFPVVWMVQFRNLLNYLVCWNTSKLCFILLFLTFSMLAYLIYTTVLISIRMLSMVEWGCTPDGNSGVWSYQEIYGSYYKIKFRKQFPTCEGTLFRESIFLNLFLEFRVRTVCTQKPGKCLLLDSRGVWHRASVVVCSCSCPIKGFCFLVVAAVI